MIKFEPIKTRKQKLEEQGLPISFAEVTISVSASKARNARRYEKKVQLVYKKKKADDNTDDYLMKRIRDYARLDKKEIFRIKTIKIIKSLGTGCYEE